MNYYYAGVMPDKQSMYSSPLAGSPMPGTLQGSLAGSPLSGPLGPLGYAGPQQSGLPPGATTMSANQSSLSHQQAAAGYSSMQAPGASPFPAVSYSQFPSAAAMYQSPLAYSQAAVVPNSATAYMVAAAGAQTAPPYGTVRLPTTSTGFPTASAQSPLYGYPGSLNGQPIYASHPGGLQAGMHPGVHPGMSPSMPPGYPSSMSSLSAGPARPPMASYPAPSPFARQMP